MKKISLTTLFVVALFSIAWGDEDHYVYSVNPGDQGALNPTFHRPTSWNFYTGLQTGFFHGFCFSHCHKGKWGR